MCICLFVFAAIIGEVDNGKLRLTLGENKREYADKFDADKRKLLVDPFGNDVDDLFPDSLDDV